MTLDGMNKYFEDRGFTVDRIRDSKRDVYIFNIAKNGRDLSGEFKYPKTNDWKYRDLQQRKFIQDLMRNFYVQEQAESKCIYETDPFATRGDAEKVLDSALKCESLWGCVTIADFAEFSGRHVEPWMRRKGWYRVQDAYVARVRDGYVIKLPEPVELNNNNKEENEMTGVKWKVVSVGNEILEYGEAEEFNIHLKGIVTDPIAIRGRSHDYIRHQVEDILNRSSWTRISYSEYCRRDAESTKNLYYGLSLTIKDVIHNDPATIVFWMDGSKTVVKCQDGDIYDPEKGLAMAFAKKVLGNQGNYYNTFGKWLPKEKSVVTPDSEAETVDRWKIWFKKFSDDGVCVGGGMYCNDYAAKSSATRAARRVYGNPVRGYYEWIVSRTNPWVK